VAKIQRECTGSEESNEDHFANIIGDEASRPENQEPHAKAKSTKESAEPFRDIFEQQRSTTSYHACQDDRKDVDTLKNVRNRWVHNIYDQNGDR